jgi:two-component sensor histidine kinase
MKPFSTNIQRPLGVCIHILVWALIFFFPILMSGDKSVLTINWSDYLRHIKMPALLLVVFYLNYLWLVPRYIFLRRTQRFIIGNLIILVCATVLTQWQQPKHEDLQKPNVEVAPRGNKLPEGDKGPGATSTPRAVGVHPAPRAEFQPPSPFRPHFERDFHPPRWTFILRDIIILLCTIGLSAAIRSSIEWRKAKADLQEAELKNLRNQMNPHFLLNTLNNIYALIAFDTEKAQQAVQDLSKLLRHLLYENQNTFVKLSKEIDFIRNYIELMRIRLSKEVALEIQMNVPEDSTVEIAPLIFIALIENAFKHGISPTEPSFIRIHIEQRGEEEVLCEISNSNHPKKDTDKSGSGIGLEQVQRRLDLLYPGRYQWTKEVTDEGKVYTSRLRIKV